MPDPAGDAPLMLEIEALSLLESAAPAPFCSAAGSVSASAGDAPLPLEIEALSLLEGATLGAVRPGSTGNAPLLLGIPSLSLLGAAWFVPDAVRVATPELNVCIAPGGPPPCHLLSTRVSTHRPAPRAPARRHGRRAKRSTRRPGPGSWGRQRIDLLGVLPGARRPSATRCGLWGRLGGTFDGARAAAISGVSSALMAYPSLCGLRARNLCADIFTKALDKTLFLRHRAGLLGATRL